MITTLLVDFSRTLLLPKEKTYEGKLNDLYRQITTESGYKFFDFYSLNDELLDFLEPLKDKFNLAIYTTEVIQNDPAIKPHLDNIFAQVFTAHDLGTYKRDPNGYKIISQKLNVSPENILFIDDMPENIEAAKQAGLQTIQFTTSEEVLKELQSKLNLTPTP